MNITNRKVGLASDTPSLRKPRDCPVEDWLNFLGHRWNALLLWHLSVSPKRHGELIALLPGVSSKVLAERLSALAQRGLIDKSTRATFPRTVSYGLSDQGVQIVAILSQIEIWSRATGGGIIFNPNTRDKSDTAVNPKLGETT